MSVSMKSLFAPVLALALAVVALAHVVAQETQPAAERKLKITGSDTMNMLTIALAEAYQAKTPGVRIEVTGGGSGRGVADLMEGLNDIAQASRRMTAEEIAKAKERGLNPQEHVIALDGLAIVVNESNPIKELTMSQVAAIFTGAVRNWKDFGGPDLPIVLYSREANCGTYDFFKEHVLKKKDFATNSNYLAATAAIAQAVGKERGGIGFGGVAYFAHAENVRVLAIAKERGQPAVSPLNQETHHVDFAAIQEGRYPVSRPLHLYTPREATGEAAKFLEWVKSAEGQAVVAKNEYIPLAGK